MLGSRQFVICIAALGVLASCNSDEPSRVVVIGDIHADMGAARNAFRLAGGIDENGHWIGGDLTIVQLGDLIGRGFEERQVLDFVLEIQSRAAAGGGEVHLLIGNHEVFSARHVYDWVDERSLSAFESIPNLDLDDPLFEQYPSNQRARIAALMPGGPYAIRLSEFPVVLKLDGTVFVHGGVTPIWAAYGIDRINTETKMWFSGQSEESHATRGRDPGNDDDGVVWSRHFSNEVDEISCAMLDKTLSILGAKRMVVAHTVQESITSRCDEKVWAIDVGMSQYYGGDLQILEILDDRKITVVRP